ncbi:IS3 family transposase [Bacillus cereus]
MLFGMFCLITLFLGGKSKSEMFYLIYFQTKNELIQAIETYIYHYNYKRF